MSDLQKRIMKNLRKEYVIACRMESHAMKIELKKKAKSFGIDPDLVTKGE